MEKKNIVNKIISTGMIVFYKTLISNNNNDTHKLFDDINNHLVNVKETIMPSNDLVNNFSDNP